MEEKLRELEDRLEDAQQKLREETRLRTAYEERITRARALCHELNQPLQVISGLSELIKLDLSENNPFFDQFQKMEQQVEKMAQTNHALMSVMKGMA